MCLKYSESGQPCGFTPCEAYKRLGEENQFLGNRLGLLEAKNAALRQGRDKYHSLYDEDKEVLFEKCDVIGDLSQDLAALRTENAELKRQNATMDTTLNIAAKEVTALRAVVEKADALVKTLEDESLSQFALKDAKAYREARHG